jgi:hypothetical protein
MAFRDEEPTDRKEGKFGNATTADAVGDLRIAGNRRDGRTVEEEA